jgi:hypothetical protein
VGEGNPWVGGFPCFNWLESSETDRNFVNVSIVCLCFILVGHMVMCMQVTPHEPSDYSKF